MVDDELGQGDCSGSRGSEEARQLNKTFHQYSRSKFRISVLCTMLISYAEMSEAAKLFYLDDDRRWSERSACSPIETDLGTSEPAYNGYLALPQRSNGAG